MNLDEIKRALRAYDGPPVSIMEICGSHTGAIAKYGIPGLLSERIRLISGPGCPVCVTPSAYIDRLLVLAVDPTVTIVTFGDLIRVPGSERSLSEAKGDGAQVEMVYSPLDVVPMAEAEPERTFVFAAVGFETTAPVLARLVDELVSRDIRNVKLLTAIKTMPPVIEALLRGGAPIDAFLAPGHVAVVTGYGVFEPLAARYGLPFVVAGFTGERLLIALYELMTHRGEGIVKNAYPSVVTREGNLTAQRLVEKYFVPSDAAWRGLGTIAGSGLLLREIYRAWDAGSDGLVTDQKKNAACICGEVLTGRRRPSDCPLYGKACTPLRPQGACMVSTEGSCFSYYTNHRGGINERNDYHAARQRRSGDG